MIVFVKLSVQGLNVQESFNNFRSNYEKTTDKKKLTTDKVQRLINCDVQGVEASV